jgi:hypothetical protein
VIDGIHPEVWMAAGYALFLVAVAVALELLARQSHKRSEGMQLAGFRYHHEHDAWECPTGRRLGRSETDHQRRVVVYRAIGHICNCCGLKKNCTDSDNGRTVERPIDSWLRSEIRRFHRGLSMTLVVLAAAILLAEIAHFDRPRELLLLGAFLAPIGIFGAKIASEFRTEKSRGDSHSA